jgi:hypothetical protein
LGEPGTGGDRRSCSWIERCWRRENAWGLGWQVAAFWNYLRGLTDRVGARSTTFALAGQPELWCARHCDAGGETLVILQHRDNGQRPHSRPHFRYESGIVAEVLNEFRLRGLRCQLPLADSSEVLKYPLLEVHGRRAVGRARVACQAMQLENRLQYVQPQAPAMLKRRVEVLSKVLWQFRDATRRAFLGAPPDRELLEQVIPAKPATHVVRKIARSRR